MNHCPSSTTDPVSIATRQRERFACRLAQIKNMHNEGASAAEVSKALTELCDSVVRQVYLAAIQDLPANDRLSVLGSLSLIAVGGYGRGDLAPYSDLDLLFLTPSQPSDETRHLVSRLVRDLWDAGLHLSQSVRSPAECACFARTDFAARTALFETRLIAGDPELFADLQSRIAPPRGRRALRLFVAEAIASRAEEQQDYFSRTAFLLEPNVKKSPGGLRDLHLLRWLAMVRYGSADLNHLQGMGVLSVEDREAIEDTSAFLSRLRHDLHFHAGSAQDVLTREEQLRLAENRGFQQQGTLLAVECFMQQYYRHTAGLHDLLCRFVDQIEKRSLARSAYNRILSHRVSSGIIARPDYIEIDASTDKGVLGDADTVIRAFDLARSFGVPVKPDALAGIRRHLPACAVTIAERRRFLQCLATPAGLGGLLRNLHRAGLLERIIPPFAHARGLIQFSLLHHYTIDEHVIRAVEAAVRRADERSPLGLAYRDIRRKDLLHLALLLHDLGKGLGEDHCEVGRRLAEETVRLFGLEDHEAHVIAFLVHRHLLMAHTSQRRDPADINTLLQFARVVTTPELLRMLYVMTAADTEAVAPGEFTAWKESLLTNLYLRAMEELTGEAPVGDETTRSEATRTTLREALANAFDPIWLRTQLDAMPLSYLTSTEPQRVEAHLRVLSNMAGAGVRVTAEYRKSLQLSQYTVFTHERLTTGIFSKIAGSLAASGFQIVDAQIMTRPDGTVLDTFRGVDHDFTGPPPPERMAEIRERIEHVLLGQDTVEALMARRGEPLSRGPQAGLQEPAQVEIDNTSSDRFTIIEVFANDRLGLLYAITRTLFELDLFVCSAKISTHYSQVVDAFYVTTSDGGKLDDAAQIRRVRDRLLTVV